ncbi:hypothetical protein BIV60_13760 [Bacillus sp. MUM 116]|uniref:hypothetical protein n=1 Tax=Bacillus sp. MUM 116 TaxID=1678002 RepID=UPI0008F5E21F|nr:hypothetical protein [Bacillus sp. MUM 116]OIK13557.1 hypothetical protein BIV60_13760 [Bacillus sp. MUM 116]
MSIGKVTEWRMTEEERQAYIVKHPIRPTKKPRGVQFDTDVIDYKKANECKKEFLRRRGKKIDRVDKDMLHKLYMSGKSLPDIAGAINISLANLNRYISEQREINPEKWPYRLKRK